MKSGSSVSGAIRRGYLLLESLLGFSIFALAATGIIVAIHRTALLSQTVAEEQRITQLAQNLLTQTLHTPIEGNDFNRDEIRELDDTTQAHILVIPHEAADQDGTVIENLYQVTVSIKSQQDDTVIEESFSTVHNPTLFISK